MTRLRRTLGEEHGAVLVAGLLLSLAVLMVIGVAVDVGHAFIVRRELVSAADDAALSALAGDQGVQAQATASPAGVSVRVRRSFPTVLLRIVGLTSLTVSAQATAAPRAP